MTLMLDADRGIQSQLPEATSKVRDFFNQNNMWFLLGRNPPVYSCRDAANNRSRLGKTGITLDDELKSFLGSYSKPETGRQLVAIHCRGSQTLDMDKIQSFLGLPQHLERLALEDLAGPLNENGCLDAPPEKADDIYGLVNPFLLANGLNGELVQQIFDASVLAPTGLPNTMMTNAGERTWSVEFRPTDLIKALSADVADVTQAPPNQREAAVGIGIITGNAPDSGILLWQSINKRVQDQMGKTFQGDLSYPPVSVRSVPGLGLSMELDARAEQVWEELAPAVESLCKDGVRLLTLACHTNHFFTDRIRAIAESYGTTFISVSEVVKDWVEKEKITQLTLAGISYVSELGPWSAYRPLTEVASVEPLSEKGLERIHELGYQVKQKGATESGRNRLRSILNDEAQTEHVVIALTEMSILLASHRKSGKSGRVIIDALELYGDAIADTYLQLAHTAPA